MAASSGKLLRAKFVTARPGGDCRCHIAGIDGGHPTLRRRLEGIPARMLLHLNVLGTKQMLKKARWPLFNPAVQLMFADRWMGSSNRTIAKWDH